MPPKFSSGLRDWGMAVPLPEVSDVEGEDRWMGGRHLTSAWTAEMSVGLSERRLIGNMGLCFRREAQDGGLGLGLHYIEVIVEHGGWWRGA